MLNLKTILISTLASVAVAEQSFGILLIRSGSPYHYSSLANNDEKIVTGGGNKKFTLTDDGALKYDDGKWIGLDDHGYAVRTDKKSLGWSTNGGYLYYDQGLIVCTEDFVGYVKKHDKCDGKSYGMAWKILPSNDGDEIDHGTGDDDDHGDGDYYCTTTGTYAIQAKGSLHKCEAIKKVDAHPHVFSVGGDQGADLIVTFQKDCSLVDQNYRGVYVDPNSGEVGNVDPWGELTPSVKWDVEDGYLTFNGESHFKSCPSGNGYSLSINDCTGGTDIGLKVSKKRSSSKRM